MITSADDAKDPLRVCLRGKFRTCAMKRNGWEHYLDCLLVWYIGEWTGNWVNRAAESGRQGKFGEVRRGGETDKIDGVDGVDRVDEMDEVDEMDGADKMDGADEMNKPSQTSR